VRGASVRRIYDDDDDVDDDSQQQQQYTRTVLKRELC
jgi:hypothetical protein